MMDEYDKCRFCYFYDDYDGCIDWFCNDRDSYRANKSRIIEKAKEEGISVSDVLTLINMNN